MRRTVSKKIFFPSRTLIKMSIVVILLIDRLEIVHLIIFLLPCMYNRLRITTPTTENYSIFGILHEQY